MNESTVSPSGNPTAVSPTASSTATTKTFHSPSAHGSMHFTRWMQSLTPPLDGWMDGWMDGCHPIGNTYEWRLKETANIVFAIATTVLWLARSTLGLGIKIALPFDMVTLKSYRDPTSIPNPNPIPMRGWSNNCITSLFWYDHTGIEDQDSINYTRTIITWYRIYQTKSNNIINQSY